MKPTTYRRLANATAAFHWVWIVIMIVSIPLAFNFQWYRPILFVVNLSTGIGQLLFLGCPLVALEQAFRRRYDPDTTYTGSFICHCLKKWFKINVPPVVIVILLVLMLIVSVVLSILVFI